MSDRSNRHNPLRTDEREKGSGACTVHHLPGKERWPRDASVWGRVAEGSWQPPVLLTMDRRETPNEVEPGFVFLGAQKASMSFVAVCRAWRLTHHSQKQPLPFSDHEATPLPWLLVPRTATRTEDSLGFTPIRGFQLGGWAPAKRQWRRGGEGGITQLGACLGPEVEEWMLLGDVQ
jgi:hypothetical protein